jgi:lysophospholipase L1-like esterase
MLGQQHASLVGAGICALFWAGFQQFMKKKLRLLLSTLVIVLLCLVAVEAACELAYRIFKGKWYWVERRTSGQGLVQPHPYFGASLIPNVSVERNGVRISHNSFGCRGAEFIRPKPAGQMRIATLGASSTYCVGVSDDETWQHFLNQQLGASFDVVNMAAPGGSSLEMLIHSALRFSDVQPDIAIYYLGWADARVQHVRDLQADWSDSHGKWVMTHGLAGRDLAEPTAAGYLLKRMAFHYFFPRMDYDKALSEAKGTEDAFTAKIDMRALGHYERNLRNIIALCRQQGVRPVFVPQIMNYRVLTSDKPYGFLPFVRDRDLKTVIGAYNEAMARVAAEEQVVFASEVLEPSYSDDNFIDQGHFSREGNRVFAGALQRALKRAELVPAAASEPFKSTKSESH